MSTPYAHVQVCRGMAFCFSFWHVDQKKHDSKLNGIPKLPFCDFVEGLCVQPKEGPSGGVGRELL